MRKLLVPLLVLVVLTLAVVGLYHSPLVLSDIRQEPLGEPAEGQATMEAAWEAHGGLERWRGLEMVELEVRGEVPLFPVQKLFGTGAEVDASLSYDPAVWGSGTMTLDGQTSQLDPASPVLLADSIRHLFELSFSMDSADVVRGLPSRDGQRRVFLSWGTDEPQRELDQYILFFDGQNLLSRFDSTGRAIAPFIHAQVDFEDYVEVQGFQIPGRVEVRRAGPEGRLVHAWTLVEARLR